MKNIIKKITPNFILEIYRKRNKKDDYNGNSVLCSICSSKFKKFGPNGLVVRENARCHKCGSLERHRLLWKFLEEKENLFKDYKKIRILHFAPENFIYDYFLNQNNIEYIPCDLFPENFSFDDTSKIVKVDITKIPFEDNYFDFILCNHVLEHIPDDKLAMSELYRVMKKDGWGIFQVPINTKSKVTYEDFSITSPEGREKAFGQIDHVRLYGLDYKEKLQNIGFEVEVDDYVNSFSTKEIFKYGFMPSELIYRCKKNI